MLSWGDFERSAPELAAHGRRLLAVEDHLGGFLATIRGDGLPRIHPISLNVLDGRLYAFITHSAKRTDLIEDGRYALHSHQDLDVPKEFEIRGRVRFVDDPRERGPVADRWSFSPDETYWLFELTLESAVLGERSSPDEWPPRYTTWRARDAEPAGSAR